MHDDLCIVQSSLAFLGHLHIITRQNTWKITLILLNFFSFLLRNSLFQAIQCSLFSLCKILRKKKSFQGSSALMNLDNYCIVKFKKMTESNLHNQINHQINLKKLLLKTVRFCPCKVHICPGEIAYMYLSRQKEIRPNIKLVCLDK